ncbi:SIR2 family NAD-dependent protein deacylase [Paenibacillus pseudetheri]|uniref:SIR2-like domain-containing protein n=1 Tax=Paenibacillus pseudetheri TaxID=2897682 RepID=A0ABM9BM20_9BACL|nr:SIR2 family protein [Paenibacillus pseudetheri]CAH1059773.1 hypothetical protein PAECIP111894_05985 [Paenibacillus pseudetheri]
MIDDVIRLIDRNGPISFFLGAGFSLGKWDNQNGKRNGLGTGEELAKFLKTKNEALNTISTDNLIDVSDEYSFMNDSEFRGELEEYLGQGTIQSSHKLLADIIFDLDEPKDSVLTVNVDDLLERAYREQHGKILKVAKRSDDIYTGGEKTYLKLHGCISEIGRAVFTTKDFITVEDNNRLFDKLKSIFSERSIVFIGFGMADIDILRMLYRVRPEGGFTKPHYWIVPKSKNWSLYRERNYTREFHINHIDMTAEDFLQKLNDHLKKKKLLNP